MSGIFWSIIVFGAVGIFVIASIYRIVAIARLPVHLRWELAPVPRRLRSRVAYMAREILLLRGVWQHNRGLWPFTFALHVGIYLFFLVVLLEMLNYLLTLNSTIFVLWALFSYFSRYIFFSVVTWLALGAYLMGTIGAICLILKRALDPDLRPFSTVSIYLNLGLLAAVFFSGLYGWLNEPGFAWKLTFFTRTPLWARFMPALPLELILHVGLFLVFLIYLPFSNMFHFAAKFFTYHEVRWDDRPLTARMEKEVASLVSRPVSWSAPHVGTGKSWAEIASGKKGDGEKT